MEKQPFLLLVWLSLNFHLHAVDLFQILSIRSIRSFGDSVKRLQRLNTKTMRSDF